MAGDRRGGKGKKPAREAREREGRFTPPLVLTLTLPFYGLPRRLRIKVNLPACLVSRRSQAKRSSSVAVSLRVFPLRYLWGVRENKLA